MVKHLHLTQQQLTLSSLNKWSNYSGRIFFSLVCNSKAITYEDSIFLIRKSCSGLRLCFTNQLLASGERFAFKSVFAINQCTLFFWNKL